jgi:hypothetical protein
VNPERPVPGPCNSSWTRARGREVLTIDADDADNLQDLLSTADTVYYDVQRRTLMFGTTEAGHHH